REQWASHIWLNPIPERHWDYTHSIGMIKTIFENEMYPLTLNGIENGMRALVR
ncbi:MAG: VWA domain-containing protein, partial [Rhodobacteraceae bacterium]|nr:VWA domain-containing protein [Paracoccaceae bacterium]